MTLALRLRNLSKIYRGGQVALDGIDLEVRNGDFFALLGPNGAGKSTTIGIVSSLIRKSGGQVQVFGHDLDRDAYQAKRLLGLVPQEFNFNGFEPIEEILVNQAGYYGVERRLAVERAEVYLRQLGLWDRRRDIARTLSGGMKRRLMIARALVHEPQLLILDEPTAGVDIELRHSMWAFLRRINQSGTTIILTTHYLEEAESLCRSIAIIDHGRIIENTTMKSLLAELQTETFVLDLAAPIAELPVLGDHRLTLVDDHTVELTVDRRQPINQVFTDLTEHGIAIRSMRNKTNRLEQLFMNLLKESGRVES